MVVLRLERRDHADDERLRTEVQLLADLAARGRVGLEASRVDTGRNGEMVAFRKSCATMLSAAGVRRIHDAVRVRCRLHGVLELLAIDHARAARQRRSAANRPDDLDLAIAALAHAVREDLRGVAPRVDDVGLECLGGLDQLAEAADRELLARQRHVMNRHAVLPQHCGRHRTRREAHDLCFDALLRHAREDGHEQRLLQARSDGRRAHDMQNAYLS